MDTNKRKPNPILQLTQTNTNKSDTNSTEKKEELIRIELKQRYNNDSLRKKQRRRLPKTGK